MAVETIWLPSLLEYSSGFDIDSHKQIRIIGSQQACMLLSTELQETNVI